MSKKPFTRASFIEFLVDGRLTGSRCESCGRVHVPPRPLCPTCHGDEMAWIEMEGRGQLVAFTTVHIGPKMMIEQGYDRKNPYCTGIVELAEGPRISARIRGVDAKQPEAIEIGTPVVFQPPGRAESGERRAFVAFRPDQAS